MTLLLPILDVIIWIEIVGLGFLVFLNLRVRHQAKRTIKEMEAHIENYKRGLEDLRHRANTVTIFESQVPDPIADTAPGLIRLTILRNGQPTQIVSNSN